MQLNFYLLCLVLIHAEGFADPDLGHGRQVYVLKVCHIWCYWSVSVSRILMLLGAVRPPPLLRFLPFTQNILRQYLKILDLAKLSVADAPLKKKESKLSVDPSQSTLKYGPENNPWMKGLNQFTYG